MRFIGRREGVSRKLAEQMDWAEETTAANDRITLFVAFNYGGRAEILDAAARYEGGGEEAFRSLLYAPEMHDPDLIIRTSGERRSQQLPHVAVGVLRAGVPRRAVAGLRPRGVRGGAGGVRRAPPALRRPLMGPPAARTSGRGSSSACPRRVRDRDRRGGRRVVRRRGRAARPICMHELLDALRAHRAAEARGVPGRDRAGRRRAARRHGHCDAGVRRVLPRAVRRDARHAAAPGPGWRSACSAWRGSASRSRTRCSCATCRTAAASSPRPRGDRRGDIGAYFGGRTFGATPLAPRVSPSKTWEGLGIGIVVGVLGVWLTGTYQDWLGGTDALLLGVGVSLAGPVGDLFESYIKRDAGIKDTGRAVRRARRGAGPARRAAVRRRRRLLGVEGPALRGGDRGRFPGSRQGSHAAGGGPPSTDGGVPAASSSSGRPGPSGPRRSTSSSAPRTSSSSA